MKHLSLLTCVLLFLNSCGISGLATGREVRMSYETDKPDNTPLKTDFLIACHTGDDMVWPIRSKEKYKDTELSIEVKDRIGEWVIAVGVLPLIPPPPYIPAFLFPQPDLCGKSGKLVLEISYIDEKKNIKEINPNEIYLITDKKELHYENYQMTEKSLKTGTKYTHEISYPLKCSKADNTIVVVDGIYASNGKRIEIPRRNIHYSSDFIFVAGYLINN